MKTHVLRDALIKAPLVGFNGRGLRAHRTIAVGQTTRNGLIEALGALEELDTIIDGMEVDEHGHVTEARAVLDRFVL